MPSQFFCIISVYEVDKVYEVDCQLHKPCQPYKHIHKTWQCGACKFLAAVNPRSLVKKFRFHIHDNFRGDLLLDNPRHVNPVVFEENGEPGTQSHFPVVDL